MRHAVCMTIIIGLLVIAAPHLAAQQQGVPTVPPIPVPGAQQQAVPGAPQQPVQTDVGQWLKQQQELSHKQNEEAIQYHEGALRQICQHMKETHDPYWAVSCKNVPP